MSISLKWQGFDKKDDKAAAPEKMELPLFVFQDKQTFYSLLVTLQKWW